MASSPLPGEPSGKVLLDRIIRVDHAGEYGALRIYAGQLDILRRRGGSAEIEHMAEQEKAHLARFEQLMRQHRVRPTALMPVWHVAGYALGALTALMGEKAAMACTVAVEREIGDHYARQAEALGDEEPDLKQTILAFRDDELEHHDTALAGGAEEAFAYPLLSAAIRQGTRFAIWLSTRV